MNYKTAAKKQCKSAKDIHSQVLYNPSIGRNVFYIGLLPSTALYGLICLAIAWLWFGLNPVAILGVATSNAGVSSAFCWFMLACIPGVVIAYLLKGLASRIYRGIHSDIDWGKDSVLEIVGNDLTNIFRGIKSIKWSFEPIDFDGGVIGALLSRLQTVIHAIWAVGLILFVVLGFLGISGLA